MEKLKVKHRSSHPFKLDVVAEKYPGSIYVGEFAPKLKGGGFADIPEAVFWQPEAHPQGSNYFGLYVDPMSGKPYIRDALPDIDGEFEGILDEEGNLMYSAFQHDFQKFSDDGVFVDGGREYTRIGGKEMPTVVKFKIVGTDFVKVE